MTWKETVVLVTHLLVKRTVCGLHRAKDRFCDLHTAPPSLPYLHLKNNDTFHVSISTAPSLSDQGEIDSKVRIRFRCTWRRFVAYSRACAR